jgi:hypothetical protein
MGGESWVGPAFSWIGVFDSDTVSYFDDANPSLDQYNLSAHLDSVDKSQFLRGRQNLQAFRFQER